MVHVYRYYPATRCSIGVLAPDGEPYPLHEGELFLYVEDVRGPSTRLEVLNTSRKDIELVVIVNRKSLHPSGPAGSERGLILSPSQRVLFHELPPSHPEGQWPLLRAELADWVRIDIYDGTSQRNFEVSPQDLQKAAGADLQTDELNPRHLQGIFTRDPEEPLETLHIRSLPHEAYQRNR